MIKIIFIFFVLGVFFIIKFKIKNIKKNNKNTDVPKFNKEGFVVFLNWANGKEILEKSNYPKYFYYNYGISDCNTFHKTLIQENFLRQATLEEYLTSKKLTELKEILDINNLKKTGNKKELISRILTEIDPNKIKFNVIIYNLTEKGLNFLKENNYILILTKTSISLEEFEIIKKELGISYTFSEIVYHIFKKRWLEEFRNKDYGLYRNTILEVANFFKLENNFKKELEYLLKVTYSDLSGNSNHGVVDDKEMLFIPMRERIFNLKEYFSIDLIEKCYEIDFPFHYCSRKIFKEIINDILMGKNEKDILEKYLSEMKKRPKKYET